MNREDWLTSAAELIYSDIIEPHTPRPPWAFKISVGFPAGTRSSRVLASCWKKEASGAGVSEIFVTPTVADSLEVLASLVHELIHYSDNCESGHRNHFARVARAVGLEGKFTATRAGAKLKAQLQDYIDILGDMPHAALSPESSGRAKQKTKLLKLECLCCGWTCRTSALQIAALNPAGAPCPVCTAPALLPA